MNVVSLILDVAAIALIALFIILGLKNGLVKSLISLLGGIIALVLAISFCGPLGNVIGDSVIKPTLDGYLIDRISETTAMQEAETAEEKLENINTDEIFSRTPEFIESILRSAGTSTAEIKGQMEEFKSTLSPGEYARRFVDSVTLPVSRGAGKAIAFVVIFVAANIAFFFVKFLFGFINKLPFIKQIDKFGGLVVGIIKGVAVVFIVAFVLKLSMPILSSAEDLKINETAVSDTVIFKTFYNIVKIEF